jgi:hypothetical protein
LLAHDLKLKRRSKIPIPNSSYILPAHHLKLKETLMLLESMKKQQVCQSHASYPKRPNQNLMGFYKLLIGMGWIQGDASTLVQ